MLDTPQPAAGRFIAFVLVKSHRIRHSGLDPESSVFALFLDSRPHFPGGKFIPAEAGTGMTIFYEANNVGKLKPVKNRNIDI